MTFSNPFPPMHVPARPSGVALRDPQQDDGPPPCPNCGDEAGPETLPFTQQLRWGCCGYREPIDPYDDPSL